MLVAVALNAGAASSAERILAGEFRWKASGPWVMPETPREDFCYSVKDPSIVRFEGQWHLFCTIRSQKRSHQIEYLAFKDWPEANRAKRHVLQITNNYFCAPQVFYFTPHRKWYLIYQASEETRTPSLQPAFSVNEKIDAPESWSRPKFLYERHPENVKSWIDFWVICDDSKAHLFFTSNDGNMWRAETPLAQFPFGWTQPQVVLKGDIFEASHTYKLKGANNYLTLVEAQAKGGRRYYKAYVADRLSGDWSAIADTPEKPFADRVNVSGGAWTDSFSHGEMLRDGYDEHLMVDPRNFKFLFQGVSEKDRAGKKYGEIPWKLGLLELVD
jgi:hypothetical protein